MGINGLWSLIEDTGTNITLDALEGKRLAIDVSFWIYQAQNGSNNLKPNSKNPFITLLINRIAKLLYHKARPVFIFDGEEIPIFKKQVLRDRAINRQLEEMTLTKAQKRIFEQLAMEHLKNNDKANPSMQNNPSHVSSIGCSSATMSSKKYDRVSTNWCDESSFSDLEPSESIDKKIALIKSEREYQKNSCLQPEEMPTNSKQFSIFQLGRLIERNGLNAQLEKLQKGKIWQNILRLSDEGQEKIIVTDKQQRVHIFTRTCELEPCDEVEATSSATFDWLHFVNAQTKCDAQIKSSKGSATFSATDSHSSDDADLISVSDCDIGQTNEVSELKLNSTTHAFLDCNEICDGVSDDEQTDEPHLEARELPNCSSRSSEDTYTDFYMLLTLLGIPFMKAPAEAEAQCVELERLGLVDGIVSDDSDVWVFGGRTVYRHMFSRKKHLQIYSAEEIGLRRAEFVQLGMLAGGDYSRGLAKIGMVTALELVSEFVGQTVSVEDELQRAMLSLKYISKWLLAKESGHSATDSTRRLRLRKTIEANNGKETIASFPNVEVFEMYAHPRVDSLEKAFCWNRADFGKLEQFLQRKLGLTIQSFNKMTFGAFEKWNEFMEQKKQRYQMRITEFARPKEAFGGLFGLNQTVTNGERVRQAIGTIKNSKNAAAKTEDFKSRKKKRRRGKRIENRYGKNRKKVLEPGRELNLSEESSDG